MKNEEPRGFIYKMHVWTELIMNSKDLTCQINPDDFANSENV